MKPLRLKAEVAKRESIRSEQSTFVAQIQVDTGVYHLDQPYDYSIPSQLIDQVSIGIRVQVPFGGREVEGLVLGIADGSAIGGLKPISKVISSISVASSDLLNLIEEVAQAWAANPYDLIRSAIPPRVASVEKEVWRAPEIKGISTKERREFLQLPSHRNPLEALSELIGKQSGKGSLLVIVPDSRSITRLKSLNPDALVLDSSLDRTDRYRNFLQAKYSTENLVIGTRSAVFADIPDLVQIIIFDEGSEHFFEQRTPGWNARDVALIRAKLQTVDFVAVGFAPSAEVARQIESGEVKFRATKSRINVESYQQEFQELLPGRIIPAIRSALKVGPVLFLASRKGYAQALSCSKCRNLSLCTCGSRLLKKSASAPIECSLCDNKYPDWSCTWCTGKVPYLLSRGTTRYSQEIGRAFPGVKISLSEGDSILEDNSLTEGIVIATPGSAPYVTGGYSAVVVLDADGLLNESDLKSLERVQQLVFSQGGFISKDGKILLVISHSSPIIGALSSWKPSLLAHRELEERRETGLPPYAKAVSIDVAGNETQQLIRGFQAAKEDGRLPRALRILGPIQLKGEMQRIVLLGPLDEAQSLVALIHEYQRRRSASKKSLLAMRIDPYSITK
ncbi:PriA Primosomal protein N' (replication factor Y) - superfamily II helicase [Candidatus Nanopelagicaceae bacterium]